MRTKNGKKAAMEMSVGTMVTIVLLMVVLVLGIFFIQKIFKSGTNAIDSIDSQVQSQIQQLFSQEGTKLAVYPTSRDITLNKGDTPKGFAFSVKNRGNSAPYTFTTNASDVSNCKGLLDIATANSYLIGDSGSFNLGGGASLDLPRLVRFSIPTTAPICTVIYTLDVERQGQNGQFSPDSTADIFVTIK